MKKLTLYIIALCITFISICTVVHAAQYVKYSSKFIKAFSDCDRYEENITSEYDGKVFNINRKINGSRNGFCRYQETISTTNDKYVLNCSFSEVQVEELTNAMKSKQKKPEKLELDLFAEQKDLKTGKIKYVVVGSQTLIGNKAFLVWSKYQNNPYFCVPQKL